MHLDTIRMAGYRSYVGKTTVHLKAGITVVEGRNLDAYDSNGSGKSSLLYAICAGLYGREPKGAAKDDLIAIGQDEYALELEFSDPDLVVRRKKSRGHAEKLAFFYDGKWTEGDLDEVQPRLEEVLGIGYSLFCNAVYVGRHSKAAQFLEAKPGERSELLEEIVSNGLIELAAAETKVLMDQTQRNIDDVTSQLAVVEREKGTLQTVIIGLKEQIQAGRDRIAVWERNRRERMGRTMFEMSDLASKRVYQGEGLDVISTQLAAAEKLLQDVTKAHGEAYARMRSAGTLETHGSCPTCKRNFPQEDVQHAMHLLQDAQQAERQAAANLSKQQEVVKTLRSRLSDVHARQLAASKVESRYQVLESELEALKRQQPEDLSALVQIVGQHEKRLSAIAGEMSGLHQTRLSEEATLSRLKFWKEGFGVNGLRNLLLDRVRLSFAEHTKRYLHQLAGEALKVRFPQVERTKSGTSRERFTINVVDAHGVERDISTYSDGEAWRVAFACLLGLGDTLMGYSKTRLQLRLIDDPVGDLDEAGVRDFINAVGDLFRETGSVLITIPRSIPLDCPHTRWVVTKSLGVSEVAA